MRKYMTVVKTSPGIEEMRYPQYYKFEPGVETTVTVQVGMGLINRWDYDEVIQKDKKDIKKDNKRRKK